MNIYFDNFQLVEHDPTDMCRLQQQRHVHSGRLSALHGDITSRRVLPFLTSPPILDDWWETFDDERRQRFPRLVGIRNFYDLANRGAGSLAARLGRCTRTRHHRARGNGSRWVWSCRGPGEWRGRRWWWRSQSPSRVIHQAAQAQLIESFEGTADQYPAEPWCARPFQSQPRVQQHWCDAGNEEPQSHSGGGHDRRRRLRLGRQHQSQLDGRRYGLRRARATRSTLAPSTSTCWPTSHFVLRTSSTKASTA